MDVDDLVRHSVSRRCWFLSKAAECGDFARAIDMARAAEEFVIGHSGNDATETPLLERDGQTPDDEANASAETTIVEPSAALASNTFAAKARQESKPSRLAIPPDRRDELLDRLAQGAGNRELAVLFGVSPKQIQGVRMGASREIAERRNRRRDLESDDGDREATVDDVVRYLRRQDDVVVKQADGTFLVNGRFRLDVAGLVAKANRMLERQHKPGFKITSLDCLLPAQELPSGRSAIGNHEVERGAPLTN